MDFLQLLKDVIIDDAYILVPVLLILGYIIKKTPNIQDWMIPYILLFVGIIFSLLIIGFNAHAVLQGILVTGASVLMHQLYKQAENKGDDQ